MEAKSGYMWNNFRRTDFERFWTYQAEDTCNMNIIKYNHMSLLIVRAKKSNIFVAGGGLPNCQTMSSVSSSDSHPSLALLGTCLKDFENDGIKLGCVNSAKRLRFLQLNGCSDQSVDLRGSQNTHDATTHDMRKRKEANAVLDSQTRSN